MLRFQNAAQVEALPDEAINSTFEVIMPKLNLSNPYNSSNSGGLGGLASMFTSGLTSYQPIVEEIIFGVTNFKAVTRRVRTMWCQVPEDIEAYHDVKITFFVSANMLTQYYLSAWRKLVYNAEGEYYNPMSVYKKNIEVFIYGPGNIGIPDIAAAHFTLKGCWPVSQGDYTYQYKDSPERLRITGTFKVDNIVYNGMTAKAAMITELVTSPTALVDKAITSLSTASSNYSIYDTYGYTGIEKDITNTTNTTNNIIDTQKYDKNGLLPNEYVDDQGLIHSTTGEY